MFDLIVSNSWFLSDLNFLSIKWPKLAEIIQNSAIISDADIENCISLKMLHMIFWPLWIFDVWFEKKIVENHCIFCTDSVALKTYWWAHQIKLRTLFSFVMIFFSCSNLRKKPYWTNVFFSFSTQTEKYWFTKLVKTEFVVRSDELIKWKMVDFKSNFSYAYVKYLLLCFTLMLLYSDSWLTKVSCLAFCKNCFFRQKRIAIPVVQQNWWVYFLGK